VVELSVHPIDGASAPLVGRRLASASSVSTCGAAR
jgi:hypothetical protein